MATGKAHNGKLYAGNPHVRFDESEVASMATPRCESPLYISLTLTIVLANVVSLFSASAQTVQDGAGPISVCLRQTPGGPRIFVEGKAVRPRFFYGSPTCLCNISTTRKTVLKIPFAANRDTTHGRIALDGYPGVDPIWYSDAMLVDLTAGTTNMVQTAEEETNTLHYVADGLAFRKGHRYHYVLTHRATRPRTYFTIEVSYSEDGRKTKLPYYYGDTLGETVAIAAEAGVDFVTFSTDSSWGCEGWWNQPEEPEDYSKIDNEFSRLLKINPRALLVPRIMTDAPAWMHERHPEMRMVYSPHCSLTMSSVSYRPYRKAACEAVERLSRHLREKFPRNYAGLQISGQNSAEWFYMLSQTEYFSGFDAATRASFREWLKERGDGGWATAEVPTPEERKSVDPSPRTVEFARFRQREMASFLVELGAAAKRGSGGNALTFFFYGYSWELGGPPAAETGHFDFSWLMKNARGKIDGFSSPLSYSSRNLAGSTVMMSAAESVMRNGYLWFNEIDHRTHHEEMWDHMALFTPYSDPNVTREVMLRDSAADILRGYGDWWMDLFGRGWYRDADIWKVRRELNALDGLLADWKDMYAPQIASVVHEDSFFRGGRDRRRYGLVKRTGFATCGADYGQYLLADVLENPPQSVKLFYLTIANDLAPDVRAKLNALKAARPDATFVENVTPQDVTAQAIAERARKAGVHCFTAPGAANVCSAEGFLLVQALQEGPLEIDFGRRGAVVDALGGEFVCNGPKASIPFRLGETRIFRMSAPDAMRGPALKDVRLEGWLGEKMDRFISRRLVDPFMREQIFDEARQTFEFRDDDEAKVGGLWRGEFWGKEMLSSVRVADYLQNKEFLSFVREECHRLMKFQDADGYLGSYADKDLISVRDLEACRKKLGWDSNWNLWNRKYSIWGMFMAYKATGDREILASVVAQTDNWIDVVRRNGVPLCDTGTPSLNGMPSMSFLKPLLMIYEETGDRKYLDFASEILPYWNREDGRPPNFFRNADSGKALHTWYPEPEKWAKSYEMMSCLDGILEYYRVTGEKRCLDAVAKIRDLLDKHESNPLGGVGFGDRFLGAASRPNGALELCDAIHWMRLNIDLYLITGEDKYLDSVERCYYNNFFAGVDRDGLYGSFLIRALARHEHRTQCGYAYSHCCVNNIPRSFMDFASTVVAVDRNGVFHVNQYQDATVTLDGVKFTIRGGYPVEGKVTVSVSDARRKVVFRKPSWCPRMDVTEKAGTYAIDFDMNPRLVASAQVPNLQDSPGREVTDAWAENRHAFSWQKNVAQDVRRQYRKTPALALWNGPLLLAKSRRLGMTTEQLEDASTVIGKGYRPILTRIPSDRVMAAWDVRLVKDGESDITAKACDFQSAADARLGDKFTWFSIWF